MLAKGLTSSALPQSAVILTWILDTLGSLMMTWQALERPINSGDSSYKGKRPEMNGIRTHKGHTRLESRLSHTAGV